MSLTIIAPMSKAFSLYNKAVSSTSFTFKAAAETKYYLVGSFNDWAQDDDYKLTDVTSSMEEETVDTKKKVAEYKLSGIHLDKDDTLKIKDDGTFYCSSYTHRWTGTSPSFDGDGNYEVPMTSNSYTFYLKKYDDGSFTTYITADKDILFFKPNTSVSSSTNNWTSGSADFWAHMWGNGDTDTKFTSVGGGYYQIDIPSGKTGMNIVRLNPEAGNTFDWKKKWNQSGDITLPLGNDDTNNCITNNAWDDWTESSNSSWEAK